MSIDTKPKTAELPLEERARALIDLAVGWDGVSCKPYRQEDLPVILDSLSSDPTLVGAALLILEQADAYLGLIEDDPLHHRSYAAVSAPLFDKIEALSRGSWSPELTPDEAYQLGVEESNTVVTLNFDGAETEWGDILQEAYDQGRGDIFTPLENAEERALSAYKLDSSDENRRALDNARDALYAATNRKSPFTADTYPSQVVGCDRAVGYVPTPAYQDYLNQFSLSDLLP
jgi:hypothetical protein